MKEFIFFNRHYIYKYMPRIILSLFLKKVQGKTEALCDYVLFGLACESAFRYYCEVKKEEERLCVRVFQMEQAVRQQDTRNRNHTTCCLVLNISCLLFCWILLKKGSESENRSYGRDQEKQKFMSTFLADF